MAANNQLPSLLSFTLPTAPTADLFSLESFKFPYEDLLGLKFKSSLGKGVLVTDQGQKFDKNAFSKAKSEFEKNLRDFAQLPGTPSLFASGLKLVEKTPSSFTEGGRSLFINSNQ